MNRHRVCYGRSKNFSVRGASSQTVQPVQPVQQGGAMLCREMIGATIRLRLAVWGVLFSTTSLVQKIIVTTVANHF